MDLFNIIPGYDSAIYQTGREPAFVMLLSFIITFIFARGYTRIARITGWGSASIGGTHAHHMVFGLIIAFMAGALMFGFTPSQGPFLLLLAALFGCGVSLVLDEFALVFHLQDVYWENEGRKSVDAIVLGVAFGTLFLLRTTPLGSSANVTGWLFVAIIAINLLFVLISAAKGKIYFALFGLFIPLLSTVAALRLAEPDSLWAHRLYKKDGKKIRRANKRYDRYNRVWKARKERIWDVIGGKIPDVNR